MALTPLYTAGLVATTDQRPLDVINDLAQAMGGQVAFVANELRMLAGVYVAPVAALGDDDFAGGTVNVQVRLPRESLFNIITGKIIDKDQNWTPDVDFPRVVAQAYIDADGVELPQDITLNAVNNSAQAQQLAAVMLRSARQALTVVATFKLTAYPIELFDTVALSSSRYGWDEKAFVVVSRKWSLLGLIELTLRETDPTIFAFGDLFDATDAAPNTSLPLTNVVQQLTGLAISSGTSAQSDGSIITRTTVTWTTATDQSVLQNGKVEIQWILSSTVTPPADWPGTTEQGGANETTIPGLLGGRAYIFRARFIGSSGRFRGPWSAQVQAVIAPPPASSGSNFLINGSFELSTAGLANNWTPFANGTTGTIVNSDATGVFGSRAQRVDCSALALVGGEAGYWQGVNVSGMDQQFMTQSIYAAGTAGAQIHLQINWLTALGGVLMSFDQTNTTLSSTNQRMTNTAQVPFGCTYAEVYFWLQTPLSAGATFMAVDAAQLEAGLVATAFVESADEAFAAANLALTTAAAAAADAALALAGLNSISSDNILTPSEKPTAVLDYTNVTAEQAGIDAQAAAFGITTEASNYDAAIAALTAYLGALTGWNVIPGANVAIVGTTWRATWAAVYGTRQTLLNKISDVASQRAAWASVTGIGKPADNASADLVLVARGQCVATGNSVTKVGGTAAWDSDTSSKNGYIGGCFAAAQPAQTNCDQMFGLNSDPTTDESYTSLDYAWYMTAGGTAQVYESGTMIAGPWARNPGDVFSIVYDGARVVYMHNNTQRYAETAPADLNLFWDSSFYTIGGGMDQIRFGPMSAVTNIGTAQIEAGAVSQITTPLVVSSLVVTGRSGTGSSYADTSRWTQIGTHTFVAEATALLFINVGFIASFSGVPSISSGRLDCEVVVNADFDNNGVPAIGDTIIDELSYGPTPNGVSVQVIKTISVRIPLAVTQGVTYEWPIYIQALEGSLTITNFSLNCELFKV